MPCKASSSPSTPNRTSVTTAVRSRPGWSRKPDGWASAAATVIAASEGFGHHRKLHAARLFELGDQPVEVTMAVTGAEADAFMARLREAGVRLFYTRAPVEFGITGEP